MGPVNWLGVLLAALTAAIVCLLWYGPLFGRVKLEEVGPGGLAGRTSPLRTVSITVIGLLLSSAMMGHMFARVGPATLGLKPWLYFMMSGGLALAFVVPALSISYCHMRASTRLAVLDSSFWLVAFLSMGAVFWALA